MIEDLRILLKEAVLRNPAQSLLLSGGLDSSILAWNLKSEGIEFVPLSVCLEGEGADIFYVLELKNALSLEPVVVKVSLEDAFSAIPDVIRILHSFDPALPNDLVLYFGLRTLKEMGIKTVMTGDGADELFFGYEYMKEIEDLDKYIGRLVPNLNFNSDLIGKSFGIEIKRPYLDENFLEFAKRIPRDMKIRGGYGKWILRKAYDGFLPQSIVYQTKRPLEVGSGMSLIRNYIANKITDSEFEKKKKQYGINFLTKDHLYYFEVYMSIFGSIMPPKDGEIQCPNCKGGKKSAHCRICGYVESNLLF